MSPSASPRVWTTSSNISKFWLRFVLPKKPCLHVEHGREHMYMSVLWVDIFLRIPDQVGLEKTVKEAEVTSRVQGLVKLKMNFWSMSFTFFQSWSIHMRQIRFATSSSLLAIPPGRGITNLLRVYDVWSSLVYSTIYYRSLKPDGNWNFLFWFVMKSYF